jgi:hypothetical protein
MNCKEDSHPQKRIMGWKGLAYQGLPPRPFNPRVLQMDHEALWREDRTQHTGSIL